MDRFANISRVPFGSVIGCLDRDIYDCKKNIELAADEEFECFYREYLAACQELKMKIIRMFMSEMGQEA